MLRKKTHAEENLLSFSPLDFKKIRPKTEDDEGDTPPPTTFVFQAKREKGPYHYARNIISVGIDIPILSLYIDDTPKRKNEGFIKIWSQRVYFVQVARKWDSNYLFQILPPSLVSKAINWRNFLKDEKKHSP